MKDKQTPLMKQYTRIKEKYPGTVLLFRLGDFFETFNEDARITAETCGITLTKRNNGAAGDMPLAGFPHHQLDAYLPKLVKAGYRVAVCEQLEDPKQSRGIVRRGVTEVVTPGVALYDKLLESKKNNYVASLYMKKVKGSNFIIGFSFADISTGEFFTGETALNRLPELIEAMAPAEIVISKKQKTDIESELDVLSYKPSYTKLEEWIFDPVFGREELLKHFKTKTLKGYGIDELENGIAASGALIHYISETRQGKLDQIMKISAYDPGEFMSLDYATRRNLEITWSFAENKRDGSLISILDKTSTPMGGRLLKNWISRPLKNLEKINKRLKSVQAFVDNIELLGETRNTLGKSGDIERLISKLCTGKPNPRDFVSMAHSLRIIPPMQTLMAELNSKDLKRLGDSFRDTSNVIELIDRAFLDEPSTVLGSGNIFRPGYSEELDGYIEAKHSGKEWISQYRDKERESTGISSLKVGYNNVFGYYIEVTKVHQSKVPESYERKQTLTNSERYTTPELKVIEEKLFSAEEKINEIENDLFTQMREEVVKFTSEIQENAYIIAVIDCLQGYAKASVDYNYVMPKIDESDKIDIKDGRHPVVERILPVGESFTPNSTKLENENDQIHILTGPNMSGKSCYLRQIALIVLLGQCGCFVPAKSAKFGIIDRIFTRVGAQDNLTAGESTFLVEMLEAANIMNNATSRSLILLDEVGRGTATFDGISIAWAITEHIHNAIGAKTLFATHYHELNELADRYDRIKNYQVQVIDAGSAIVFSHKVKPGYSDHSFGIYVAKMAGLPKEIVKRADEILKTLESTDEKGSKTGSTDKIKTMKEKAKEDQLAIFEFRDDELRDKVLNLKLNNLTPIQAMQVLADLQKEARRGRK